MTHNSNSSHFNNTSQFMVFSCTFCDCKNDCDNALPSLVVSSCFCWDRMCLTLKEVMQYRLRNYGVHSQNAIIFSNERLLVLCCSLEIIIDWHNMASCYVCCEDVICLTCKPNYSNRTGCTLNWPPFMKCKSKLNGPKYKLKIVFISLYWVHVLNTCLPWQRPTQVILLHCV